MKKILAVTLFCVCIPLAYGYTVNYGNGDKYVGGWVNAERHGKGTYTWKKTGNKYVGKFLMGKRHGHGTFTYGKDSKHSGDEYVGEFKNNKFHGQGTYTFANGRKIVGEAKEGKPWNAIKYNANGSVSGTYTEGKWCAGCGSTNATSAASGSSDDSAVELEFWHAVKNSNDLDLLQAYLDEYPNGKFVPLVKIKIKRLNSVGGDN